MFRQALAKMGACPVQQHAQVVRGNAERGADMLGFAPLQQLEFDRSPFGVSQAAHTRIDRARQLTRLGAWLPERIFVNGQFVGRHGEQASGAASGTSRLAPQNAQQERSHLRAALEARHRVEERHPRGVHEVFGFDPGKAEPLRGALEDEAVCVVHRPKSARVATL
ncbi:MAG TPA: hypothetical protein VJU61_21845 [Polyangiaceae bacterium]|nr:hypothetical protein [Polyangiaceae bacterium]